MSVVTDRLHRVVEEMLPDAFRAEIVDGELIVTAATPFFRHALVIRALRRAIGEVAGLIDLEVTTVALPATDEEFVPDLAYYRAEEIDPEGWIGTAHSLVLAVEVVSGHDGGNAARRDREDKARGYAASGVPLYLLVDEPRRAVVLHSLPTYDPAAKADRYSKIVQVPYGERLELPGPFLTSIDTGTFHLKP